MSKLKRNLGIALGIGAAATATGAFLHWNNTSLQFKEYKLDFPKLPESFKGFRIAHISDFHNTKQLEYKVIKLTKFHRPDIIVITGDLIDCRTPDIPAGLSLARELVKIAPVYMVCGNHEARMDITPVLREHLRDIRVNLIEGEKVTFERNGEKITLAGALDPRFFAGEKLDNNDKNIFRRKIMETIEGEENFKILISHRPEFFESYCIRGIDLALTGHAHGGQFGIPFTDMGVFVPNQGLLPEFAAGKKQEGDTTMIISRGIGNSQFPFRLFNLPEVVAIELG